jgi:flagellar protein FliO/FliZ
MVEMVLRIGFSLLVVLGLLWLLARVARRPLSGRAAGALAVLARQQVTRGSTVAVVRVVDRALILGVTDGHVTLLGETDLAALEQPAHEHAVHRHAISVDQPVDDPGRLAGSVLSPRTWAQVMEFVRSRTVRQ